MLSNDLEIYDSCDLEKLNIPSRSRLYHLNPIGLDTPYVESLTSYIARLAEAHSLSPNSLITQLISSELQQTFIKNCSSRNLGTLFKKSRFINGHGQIAQEIQKSLKKLTLRQNLDRLTVLRYSQVLSPRNLFKNNKSWCSACYEQWRISKQTIYEPLLWTFADVKVCLHHYQPLRDICPHCNKSMPWLTGKTRVGYCPHCNGWLGNFSQDNYRYSESELTQHIWIGKTIGELISCASEKSNLVENSDISKSLKFIINNIYEGNITRFAKFFGLPKNTVWMWCKAKSLPEFRNLLKICYCLDISLLDFILCREGSFHLLKISSSRLPTSPRIKRKSPTIIDVDTVENYLQTTLYGSDKSPLTMKEVAEKLEIPQRTIKRNFPTLCKAISAKYRSYQQANKAKGIENCCREIKQAVISLYQSGEYPTEARVSQLISQPGYFRYKEVRKALKEAILAIDLIGVNQE